MIPDWDVKKAEELCKAMQDCINIDELNHIAHGIALLSDRMLSNERRQWLRDIYISCKHKLTAEPFSDDHLTKKGKNASLRMQKERKEDIDAKGIQQVPIIRTDNKGKVEGMPLPDSSLQERRDI